MNSEPIHDPRSTPDSQPLSCQGYTIDLTARIRYRTQALIKAPLDTIWNLQTDVERWPEWQQSVASSKRLDSGPLQPGTQFQWAVPVPGPGGASASILTVNSTVKQIEPRRAICWSGPASTAELHIDDGIHVWTFTPLEGGVLVCTEENWRGAAIEADVQTATALLGGSLEAWLSDLRSAAEGA